MVDSPDFDFRLGEGSHLHPAVHLTCHATTSHGVLLG